MGYGDAAGEIFDTETAVKQLANFIADIGKKVTLVGFSLGAQLSVKLCAEYPQYFTSAIIVSPWLIKKEPMLSKVMACLLYTSVCRKDRRRLLRKGR